MPQTFGRWASELRYTIFDTKKQLLSELFFSARQKEYGFNVEDIEPFPDSSYKPKYTDYSKLNKKYDVIISNAVLNVLPQDQRDALTVKMGQMLNDGGRMFVNVRGSDVRNASSKVAIDEANMEYYISNTGSYQKGFSKKELVAYLSDALGNGYTVTGTNKFGAVSAVVTKKPSSAVRYSRQQAKYDHSKPFDKRRKKEPIEASDKKRYNKSGKWSETETLFMQWENGSAPVGEVKKFTRFKKHHFYEKTADGCVEITRAEYNKRRTLDEENIDRRSKRGIGQAANSDGSAEGNAAGHHNGNRHAAGAEILSRHTVGERLRNDTGGSVSSVDRDGTGVSDAIDLSREPETLNELRRQNTQLKKRVEYWRGQAKTTRVKTVREGDVKKLAREIIEMNATNLKPKDITEQLGELGKYILNSEELRYTDISKMADDIASDVSSDIFDGYDPTEISILSSIGFSTV